MKTMSVKTKHAEVKASSPIRTSLYEREGSMWGRLKRPSPGNLRRMLGQKVELIVEYLCEPWKLFPKKGEGTPTSAGADKRGRTFALTTRERRPELKFGTDKARVSYRQTGSFLPRNW